MGGYRTLLLHRLRRSCSLNPAILWVVNFGHVPTPQASLLTAGRESLSVALCLIPFLRHLTSGSTLGLFPPAAARMTNRAVCNGFSSAIVR